MKLGLLPERFEVTEAARPSAIDTARWVSTTPGSWVCRRPVLGLGLLAVLVATVLVVVLP